MKQILIVIGGEEPTETLPSLLPAFRKGAEDAGPSCRADIPDQKRSEGLSWL